MFSMKEVILRRKTNQEMEMTRLAGLGSYIYIINYSSIIMDVSDFTLQMNSAYGLTLVKPTHRGLVGFEFVGRLRGLNDSALDHRLIPNHLSSNIGVGITQGYFIFYFASLPLQVAWPI